MNYRRLGKSDLNISEIGFGCMSLEQNQSVANRLIDHATGLGINFFDTADLYQKGTNETMLGIALKEKRKKVIIATKVGNQLRPDGNSWDWNPSKKYILAAIERSLERLQTDYIDLYQLHGGTIGDDTDETIDAFESLKKQGKIRYYGISSIRPDVIREYVKRSRITSVMMQYSLLDRRPEEACLELLYRNQIGVLARGPLAKGLLAGKPAVPYLDYSAGDVKKIYTAVYSLSAADRSPGQTAIRAVLQHPAITAAVTGIRTMEQLIDAAGASSSLPLTGEELEMLTGLLPRAIYKEHR